MNLKQRYNQWLFHKYGFNTRAFFESIPLIYRVCPLFSPSCYTMAKGEQIKKWLEAGIEEGLKERNDNG